MSRGRRVGGFTLLETLVAITLLALLLGALMPVFQQGLAGLRVAERHGRAVLLAQSLLERATSAAARDGGAASGAEGDFRWTVERDPFDAEDGGPPVTGEGPFRLEQVAVTVTWPGNEAGVRLVSLALESTR